MPDISVGSAPIIPRRVHAQRLIGRMRGQSQPDMVETDAGYYVVKWKQNAQHRRVLVNEVLGAVFLRRLGISSPDWAMVHVDQGFLRNHPEARIVLKGTSFAVEPGWHFGSKVPVNPERKAIYDFIPRHVLARVSNLSDFLRVLAFDQWVDNCDGRQAIFFSAPHRQFTAQMIDNGHLFGFDESEWRLADHIAGNGYYLMSGAFVWPQAEEQIDTTIAQIQAFAAAELDAIRQGVPAEWLENDGDALGRVFDKLYHRSKRLPNIVSVALETLKKKTQSRSFHEQIARVPEACPSR